MRATPLLVLGCGPKALAIAAKAKVLSEERFDVPEIVIVEKDDVGAHWGGHAGYTDGTHSLGTPPEKDIGFPYASIFGPSVDNGMLQYSWQAFLVENGSYADWVDRGKPHPLHRRWRDYVRWIKEKLSLRVVSGAVLHIDADKKNWHLRYRAHTGPEKSITGSGLVITGPGDPIRMEGQSSNNPRVFDGKTFWQRIDNFNDIEEDAVIGVVGSGETAAAVVVALLQRVSSGATIYVINRQGAVFTRGESYDENSLYSDPSTWEEMDLDDRREFIARTDRGVFSVKTKSVIDHAENVTHKLMDVARMEPRDDGVILHSKGAKNLKVDYVVNTTAFDPLWFIRFATPSIALSLSDKSLVEQSIERDLSVKGMRPRLHLPMLAALARGPGFPNLSSLGLLSDRILKTYSSAKRRTRE